MTVSTGAQTGVMDGVRVLEVAEYAMVPAAGAVLAEWGAEVVKVEHPVRGDAIRGLRAFGIEPGTGGFTYLWEVLNRGKKSVGVDIGTDAGRELVHELAARADVFITSFLPDARVRLGIDEPDIRAINPAIVYGRGSAHGPDGPEAERGGFDGLTYWYRSGAAAAAVPAGSEQLVALPGPAFGDIQTGMSLAGGIAAALFRRERTGTGSVVDTSLLGSGMWAMQATFAGANTAGLPRLPARDRTTSTNPINNTYRTADGRFIALAMLQADRYWPDFCHAIGHPDLLDDPRYATIDSRAEHHSACISELDDIFASHPLEHWRGALGKQEGQWCVVQEVGDLNHDEQAHANGYLQTVDYGNGRTLRLVPAPVQFDRAASELTPAPGHGEHTDEVLGTLGHDSDRLIQLKIDGVIT